MGIDGVATIGVVNWLPLVEAIDLVEGDHERGIFVSKELDGLSSLWFKRVHDINDKDSHVTKGGTSRTQIGERLVTWCINDEEAWNLQVELFAVFHLVEMGEQVLFWEIGGTDLLGDTASLTGLDVGASQLIQDQSLTSVDVTHHADDWATKLLLFALLLEIF